MGKRPTEYGLFTCVHISYAASLLPSQALWNNARTCVYEVVAVIDPDGFRPNVGIILTNDAGQVLWARRINQDA